MAGRESKENPIAWTTTIITLAFMISMEITDFKETRTASYVGYYTLWLILDLHGILTHYSFKKERMLVIFMGLKILIAATGLITLFIETTSPPTQTASAVFFLKNFKSYSKKNLKFT